MFDYKEFLESLTESKITNMLEEMNIPYTDKGDYFVMPTFCHNHMNTEASNKLYYYKNSHTFMCYTCCGAMSPFRFLESFYTAQGIEDYDWYEDVFCLLNGKGNVRDEFTTPVYKSIADKYTSAAMPELVEYDKKALDSFVKYYPPEWLKEGITKQAMDKYNIRYSITQNKIIIPHYDVKNRLVGIRGRALNPEEVEAVGKYMPVQIEGVWYKHPLSMNLYGLLQNKEAIKKNGYCYVFEGEKSVLIADSFSKDNCSVSVCGSQFNKFELRQLMQAAAPREIIICFDNEELPHSSDYFNKLWRMCKKYANYADFSFIYDTKGLTEMKDSPVDKGEEIFTKLLKKRVKVK